MIKINKDYKNVDAIYLGTFQHGLMQNNMPLLVIGLMNNGVLEKSLNVEVKIKPGKILPNIGEYIDVLEITGSELNGYKAKIDYLEDSNEDYFGQMEKLNDLKNVGVFKMFKSEINDREVSTAFTGNVLLNLQNALGLNKTEMAEILGVDRKTVQRWENENNQINNIYLERLSEHFTNLKAPINLQLDWISFNFPNLTGEDVIKDVLNLKKELFLVRGTSQNFYTREFAYGGDKNIYVQDFAPNEEDIQKPGATLFMTGIGTRLFETSLLEQSLTWEKFFSKMYGYQGHCTRLDIAINDKSDLLNMDNIVNAVQEKRFWSKSRSYAIHGNGNQGWTVNFGKSPFVIRIYDKFKEQESHGKLTDINTRVELELHGDKATQFIDEWLGNDNFVQFTFDILNSYLLFVADDVDETQLKGQNDRERYYQKLNPLPEWALFTSIGGAMRFTTEPKQIDIVRIMSWLEKYVAPSLKIVQQTGEWDKLMKSVQETELSPSQETLVQAVNSSKMSESLKF